MLKAQQREHNPAKRKDIIGRAATRINTEMYWAQGPYHRVAFDFRQPRLQNHAPSFANIGWPLLESWLSA